MEDILVTGPHDMEALFLKIQGHELSVYLSWEAFKLPPNTKQLCIRGRKALLLTQIRVSQVLESGALHEQSSPLFKKVRDRMEKQVLTCGRPKCVCEQKQLAAILPSVT